MALALPDPAGPAAALASALHADARSRHRALQHSRAHARAHQRWQAGRQHAQSEEWPLAAHAFEQAAALHDDSAYALAAAHALIKAGRSQEAVQRARRIRTSDPRSAPACLLESHALLGLGRAEDAVTCLRALPEDVARDHAHHVSLAIALQRCHRHEEAVRAFFDALVLKMDDGVTHFQLGMSFKDLGMKAEAAECVRSAVLFGVGSSELAARGQLAFMEREACRWGPADEALAGLRQAVQALPDGTPMETGPFPHAVLVSEPMELLKVARHYALHAARGVRVLPRRSAAFVAKGLVKLHPNVQAKTATPRLRIGYLSADFHQHATSQLLVQLLECHDRSAFEVTLLSTGPDDGTPMCRRVRAASEHFEELRGQSFEAMAQRARALRIDILVDLKGVTFDTLMPVLAHRAAPLQVTWLGFPGSTGAPYIDYLIGDPQVTPLAHAAHFSEKLAQLPHCYQPNDAQRELPLASTRADWGVLEGELLLCGFHQSYKISAEVFDHWCELLQALPQARLWLLQWNANVQAMLTAAARSRGIEAQRLVFAPLLPVQEHLSRLAVADVYLDAWPCNAHTTASEALWCGVPVVTVRGATFAQRVAASLLHNVALDELVCDDTTAYRDTVLALAADPLRRSQLRAHLIAQRSASPLFDGALRARELEQLYLRMWQRCQQGLAPEHLPALAN